MSHEIRYRSYPENVDRNAVKKSWDIVVQHEDYQEGASGLYRDIRWLENEPVAESYEAAEKRIRQLDRGDYDCLAVRYRDVITYTRSKREAELRTKLGEAIKKYQALCNEPHFKDAKIKFIGCPNCGSKLNTNLINKRGNPNHCPLCGTDLRPATKLKQIEAAEKAYLKLSDAADEEAKKNRSKSKNVEIKWLLKVEFHT